MYKYEATTRSTLSCKLKYLYISKFADNGVRIVISENLNTHVYSIGVNLDVKKGSLVTCNPCKAEIFHLGNALASLTAGLTSHMDTTSLLPLAH